MEAPREGGYTARWPVRVYELDSNGHVNNAVYLGYAEEVAAQHAEAMGFGRGWSADRGGTWVVRKHEITYHWPATYGDVLVLRTRIEQMRGARGVRRTRIAREDGRPIAEVLTEWVWLRADGRPARVPQEVVEAFEREARDAPASAANPALPLNV